VITQVYTGKVDAGAAFYSPEGPAKELRDARARVSKKYPDVEKEVIILAKTEAIPNDPITFSKSVSADDTQKLVIAMVKIANTEEGKKLLKDMYDVEGLIRASDADYYSLRTVIGGK
jgi:phosphonate transport system substrate-binding protein